MAEEPEVNPSVPVSDPNEPAEIYSVSQDKSGTFQFSRRDFLMLGMAAGGALLVKGVCPRFGEGAGAKTIPPVAQAGMMPLPKVYLHALPSLESDILDILKPDELVRLIADHPETGWVEIETASNKTGWLRRMFVDFSRAIRQASKNFSFNPIVSQQTVTRGLTAKLVRNPAREGRSTSCGDPVLNGNFESGHATWVEESWEDGYSPAANPVIITTDASPYEGSYVALFGGVVNTHHRLTQTIYLPATTADAQLLEFYIRTDTAETSTSNVYDWLRFRILDSGGNALTDDINITDNLETISAWTHVGVSLTGVSSIAGTTIQIQFEGYNDISNDSHFYMDSVVFNLDCSSAETATPTATATPTSTPTSGPDLTYIFLPIIYRMAEATPTATSTPTSTPTSVPCSSYTCSCNTSPCSCDNNPCSTNNTCPGNSICPPVDNCPLYTAPCYSNSFCPPVNQCPLYVVPCYSNSFCPPVNNCPLYNPCTCNNYIPPPPCTCNSFPCTCNNYIPPPPCTCNVYPCTCNFYIPPPPCSCNVYPCTCNFHF